MKNDNHERVNEFLHILEDALKESGHQPGPIVEEVRSDLEDHLQHFLDEGMTEEEATTAALAEMGNPYELAHGMRREIPPFSGPSSTIVRYLAVLGNLVWAFYVVWNLRAWSYGLEGTGVALGVLLFHFPLVLILWPRIVWRRNWLFGLIPAGLAFAVLMMVNLAGVRSEESITLPQTPSETEAHAAEIASMEQDKGLAVVQLLILITLVAGAIILILAIQRNSQRRLVLFGFLIVLALVELPFQIEEWLFRNDRDQMQAYLDSTRREKGTWPSSEEIEAKGPPLRGKHAQIRTTDDGFMLFWSRPLSSGFALHYSSSDDQIYVQD